MAKRLKRKTLEQLVKLGEDKAKEYLKEVERRYERKRERISSQVGVTKIVDEIYTPSTRDVRVYLKTLIPRAKKSVKYGVSEGYFENIQDIVFKPIKTTVSSIIETRIDTWTNAVLSKGFAPDVELINNAMRKLTPEQWNKFFRDDHYFQQAYIDYKWEGGNNLTMYHHEDVYGTGLSPWTQRLKDFAYNRLGIDLSE